MSLRKFADPIAPAEAKDGPARSDDSPAFERPELRALLELWRSKAAGGVPARSAFDMRALKAFAPHVMIMECEGEGPQRRYKFRLFGSALQMLFGEHTGRYLDEMVSPALLPGWRAVCDDVVAARRPLRIVTHFCLPSQHLLRGEFLMAPMTDAEGALRMILAATYVGRRDVVHAPFG